MAEAAADGGIFPITARVAAWLTAAPTQVRSEVAPASSQIGAVLPRTPPLCRTVRLTRLGNSRTARLRHTLSTQAFIRTMFETITRVSSQSHDRRHRRFERSYRHR